MPEVASREPLPVALRRLTLAWRDRWANLACRRSPRRLLIVRHPAKKPTFYHVLLSWIEEHVPELRGLFELRLLPFELAADAPYALHVPWLQDPVQHWSPAAYDQARRLARQCDDQGIPIVNRVDQLPNAIKSEAARRLAEVGVRMPAMRRVVDAAEFRRTLLGLKLPLFIREDQGHGGAMLRADTASEVARLPLEQFQQPLAVELIDVRWPADGMFRKYRYVVAGELGVPHHMQATGDWITRGTIRVHSPALHQEEIDYVSRPELHHELFQRARRALNLDFVALDYGFDAQGQLVIWEANPFPHFHIPRGRLLYLRPAVNRTLAAMVHLYLTRAGLPIPDTLAAYLDSPAVSRSTPRAAAA